MTRNAQYSDRIWHGHSNPNFLLSGQLSSFDSVDYRAKIDREHIIKPERLYNDFQNPASITLNVKNWSEDSKIYLVVTSYKYLKDGEQCQVNKEFDCFSR